MDKPSNTNETMIYPVDKLLADRIRVIHISTVIFYQHFINNTLNNYPQKMLIINFSQTTSKIVINYPCLIVSVNLSILLLKSFSFSIFSLILL